MDTLVNVLLILGGVVLAVSAMLGLLNPKTPAIWTCCGGLIIYCVMLCAYIQGVVWKQEADAAKQQEERSKEQGEFNAKLAEFKEASDANKQEVLKWLADHFPSSPESVKTLIESTKDNPQTLNTVIKAIAVSPALEDAIRKVDPGSKLLPEEKAVSGGSLVIERSGNQGSYLELHISPNTVLRMGLNQGSYQAGGGGPYRVGRSVIVSTSYFGTDIRPGSGIIDGQDYPRLVYRGNLKIVLDPIVIPESPPPVIQQRFTFDGTIQGFTGSPGIDANETLSFFNYHLQGKGTAYIHLTKPPDYPGMVTVPRTEYRFD